MFLNNYPQSYGMEVVPSIEPDYIPMTREAWLERAVDVLTPLLNEAGLEKPCVKVSTGFPSKMALSMKKRRIGECWHKDPLKHKASHIFISPLLGDQIEVLGTLLHELIHAALPPKTAHGPAFAKAAKATGLEGKPTATVVGALLAMRLNDMFKGMSPYPHVAFNASELEKKKQTTRLRLYQCQCEEPIKLRVAKDDLDATCNICDSLFTKVEKGE